MLYATEKLPMPKGDVYALDEYPKRSDIFRAFLKQMLLAMVNSGGKEETRKALQQQVYRFKTLRLPSQIKSCRRRDLYPIMDALGKKHKSIKHYFNTGKGIDLQFLDSQMAEKVLLHFTKMGYAVLPMHDSFILHHGLEQELHEVMRKAFYENLGQEIGVGVKFRSIAERQKAEMRQRKREGKTEDIDIGEILANQGGGLKEILAEEAKYSIYNKFLRAHRNQLAKIQQIPSYTDKEYPPIDNG